MGAFLATQPKLEETVRTWNWEVRLVRMVASPESFDRPSWLSIEGTLRDKNRVALCPT